ncbi:MAG: hypothetical protein J6R32_06475 [Bacteroidales bacterium]|nr:hypothetical protein [Bacteroidales bacterium]
MANMVNVLNAILANASTEYQTRVPTATQNNITEVGSAIMSMKTTQNEFLSALVNKIAMTIVHNKTFTNPLSVLKKGSVPLGKNIEEIMTNPVTGTTYDPTGADLLARAIPDTKAIYHTMNRQGKYKATVSKAQLFTAFQSYTALEDLLNSIVNSIYSGDNLDEFILMKNLFASAIAGGKVKKIEVSEITDKDTAKDFVKAVRIVGQDMAFPSDKYNSYYDINKATDPKPAITWTPIEDQVLILRNDVSVDVDVELLANAFNVSYTDLKQRTLITDTFGTATNCMGILCDKSFIRVYDNLMQMEDFHNGEGLYDNYILHHWQTYSLSLFANAVAFVTPGDVTPGE